MLIASYHLFVYTEWVYDLETRFTMGWSLLTVVCLNLTFNIFIILFVVLKEMKNKTRQKYGK